jgi:hypothetical protein
VVGGKLLDSEAEPMSYRQTGDMDGASALFPDVFAMDDVGDPRKPRQQLC